MFFYLHQINNIYYFRIRIPLDLQQWFDRPEIKRSLRTKNPSHAKSQCRLMTSKAEHLFSQIRSGLIADDQVQQLQEKYFPSQKMMSVKAEKPRLLAEVRDAYIKEHVLLGQWTEKTKQEVESALNVAVEVIGNHALTSINRQDMVDYLSKLKRLPANLTKAIKYRDHTIEQILDMDVEKAMSQRTINKYISRVSSLFIWCMRQKYVKWNPAEALTVAVEVKEDEERKAYQAPDIVRVISSIENYKKGAPERYFVPLVAMYSGLRLNEICQLSTRDIVQVDGVWCFDINDDGDRKLKNKASRRVVPVHPELVRIGLLDHLKMAKSSGHPRLWMNLERRRDGYGHLFSKWYQRFNRKHITQDPKKVFHSFRHLVADTLKQKGVADGVIAEILGHANSSITTGRYGKRYRPQVLLDALMKLDFGLG